MEKIQIILNSKYYSKEAIAEGIKDFESILDAKIINNSFLIEITPKEKIPFLEHEFANYVLGLIKHKELI